MNVHRVAVRSSVWLGLWSHQSARNKIHSERKEAADHRCDNQLRKGKNDAGVWKPKRSRKRADDENNDDDPRRAPLLCRCRSNEGSARGNSCFATAVMNDEESHPATEGNNLEDTRESVANTERRVEDDEHLENGGDVAETELNGRRLHRPNV